MESKPTGAMTAEGATAHAGNSGAALKLLEKLPELVNNTVLTHPEELVVLQSRGFGLSVEPQRTWILFLLSAIRKEALRLGLIIRVRGEDREGGGRVFSTRSVTVEDVTGTVWLEGIGTGEDASNEALTAWNPQTRQKEYTGEVALKENAARSAETRALKRAIEVLGSGEMAAAFVRLSRVAEQLAGAMKGADVRTITAELHRYLSGRRNNGNGNGGNGTGGQSQPEKDVKPAPKVPRVVAKSTYSSQPAASYTHAPSMSTEGQDIHPPAPTPATPDPEGPSSATIASYPEAAENVGF